MDDSHLRQCLLLHSIPGLKDAQLCALLLHYGSPAAICASNTHEWRALGVERAVRASARLALRLGYHPRAAADIDKQLELLQRSHACILAVSDAAYPPLLRAIHDPPPLLYLRGDADLLQQAQLAVVGSRRATPAGLRATQELALAAARSGLVITSGLAIGVDGAAHRAALDAQCPTIAVMATGIEQIYPVRHRQLGDVIPVSGCLVTEFPPGMPPLRENFPRRNRVVTGLALGTLVVEAALPSGSLISAGSALEQGREVFALPWSIHHQGGAGCLQLLKDGAHLVLSFEDILDELGPIRGLQRDLILPEPGSSEACDELEPELSRLLHLVGYEVIGARDLVQLSALPVARIMAGLSMLELRGLVSRCEGGYVRR
ncbi:MAG: DNA-processing protein DprA [Pseudomonadota bacterium]